MLLALSHRMIHLLCTSDRDKQILFLKENWSWIGMYIMRAATRITDVEDGGPFIFAFKKRIAPIPHACGFLPFGISTDFWCGYKTFLERKIKLSFVTN